MKLREIGERFGIGESAVAQGEAWGQVLNFDIYSLLASHQESRLGVKIAFDHSQDDRFIHAALTAQARWLVTGDRDLLELCPLPDLAIISPAEALHRPDAPWS